MNEPIDRVVIVVAVIGGMALEKRLVKVCETWQTNKLEFLPLLQEKVPILIRGWKN